MNKYYKLVPQNSGYHDGILEADGKQLIIFAQENIFSMLAYGYGTELYEVTPLSPVIHRIVGDFVYAESVELKYLGNVWDNIDFLLQKGANVESDKFNILCSASYHGMLDIVKYLVEKKKLKILTDKNDAIWSALRNNNFDIVEYFIKQGADIKANQYNRLINISLEGVKYLIEKGYNIRKYGGGAINEGARNGKLEIIKYIVEKGFNINTLQSCGDNQAVDYARAHGHQDIVNYLLEVIKTSKKANLSEDIEKFINYVGDDFNLI